MSDREELESRLRDRFPEFVARIAKYDVQVLFDVTVGLKNGEYPVVYYAHEDASIDGIAESFEQWLNKLEPGE